MNICCWRKEWKSFVLNQIIQDGFMEEQRRKGKRLLKHSADLSEDCYINKNPSLPSVRFIISGSSVEGLATPKTYVSDSKIKVPDTDFLMLLPIFTVTNNWEPNSTFILDSTNVHCGYTRLKLIQKFSNLKTVYEKTKLSDTLNVVCTNSTEGDSFWVESDGVFKPLLEAFHIDEECNFNHEEIIHGPARKRSVMEGIPLRFPLTEKDDTSQDFVPCLHCNSWPPEGSEWEIRERKTWPKRDIRRQILSEGCHLVPVAHAQSSLSQVEWRFSFSTPEAMLCKTIPYTAKKAYIIFKLLCKHQFQDIPHMCTYHMKTTLFWAIEKSPDLFHAGKEHLLDMLLKLVEDFLLYLEHQTLPSYFISSNNLIDHIPCSTLEMAMSKVQRLKASCIDVLFEVIEADRLQSLPLVHDLRSIFEPCLYNIKDYTCSVEAAIEESMARLVTAFYMEGNRSQSWDTVQRFYQLPGDFQSSLDTDKLRQRIVFYAKGGKLMKCMIEKCTDVLDFGKKYGIDFRFRVNPKSMFPHILHIVAATWMQRQTKTISKILQLTLRVLEWFECQFSEHQDLEALKSHQVYSDFSQSASGEYQLLTCYFLFYLNFEELITMPDRTEEFVSILEHTDPFSFMKLFLEEAETLPLAFAMKELVQLLYENSLPIDSSHFLLAHMLSQLGRVEEAALQYYFNLLLEHQRQQESLITDNGFIYKLCVFSSWLIQHDLLWPSKLVLLRT